MKGSVIPAVCLAAVANGTGWAYVLSGRLRFVGGGVLPRAPEWLWGSAAVIGIAVAGGCGIWTSTFHRPWPRLLRGVLWAAAFAVLLLIGPGVRYGQLRAHARSLPLPAGATELAWSTDIVRFDRRPDYDLVVRSTEESIRIYYDCWADFKAAGWNFDQRSEWRAPNGRTWHGWLLLRGDEATAVHFFVTGEWGSTNIHVSRLDLPVPGVPQPNPRSRYVAP